MFSRLYDIQPGNGAGMFWEEKIREEISKEKWRKRISGEADDINKQTIYHVSQKSEPLNILQQQPQICSDLNKILHTQDDICYKHYYIVSYKSALTLLKY